MVSSGKFDQCVAVCKGKGRWRGGKKEKPLFPENRWKLTFRLSCVAITRERLINHRSKLSLVALVYVVGCRHSTIRET
jgi:hypothetical protein